MPSQIVTTFGSYATAPTQIVWPLVPSSLTFDITPPLSSKRSEQRHSQYRSRDELAQDVTGGCHDGARMGIAKQAFDAHVLRERRAPASAHRGRGDANCDLASGGFCFEYTKYRRIPRPLEMINQIIDPRRESIGVDLHGCELCAQGRQTLAETEAQMFEPSVLEMRRGGSYRGSTESQRHR